MNRSSVVVKNYDCRIAVMPTVSISVSDIAYRYLHAGKKGSRINGVSARANRAIINWLRADQLQKDNRELRKEMRILERDKEQMYKLLVDAGVYEPEEVIE